MGFETIVTNDGRGRLCDGHGGYWERGCNTELIALETDGSGGLATESSADLLPANSIIEAVTARITTTIVGGIDWAIGDASVGTRFADATSVLTAGIMVVGLNHVDQTDSSPVVGARQTSAGKVVITTSATPSSGVIRVSVYYSRFVSPTE